MDPSASVPLARFPVGFEKFHRRSFINYQLNRAYALGYADRITTRIGDGYAGWPEHAPFDAIVVTAAPEEVPPPLIEQLAPGGRLVIPLGTSPLGQQLSVLEKAADGAVTRKAIVAVSFVPLTRGR